MSDRRLREVHLEYRLVDPWNRRSATTQGKRWFFEIPAALDTDAAFLELLHRIFYDSNMAMRQREPTDRAWLELDSYRVVPVDPDAALSWSGETTREAAFPVVPWYFFPPVWEFAAIFWVDDEGRYDGLDPDAYSELILFRALEAGRITEERALAFVRRLYPTSPNAKALVLDDRKARLANIVGVRPTALFRKAAGAPPIASGPLP